ncbi:hypothetical protein Pla110_01110 [Polystyrenella longa]|uniref:Uncharacterized protein n=1 Tax=Polystyrenella longa TaxID=2528007 RepID=A0A518CGQ8_9PLAN|nr:hypothetical protein Pla110_01110 [Polystyrenella longa]
MWFRLCGRCIDLMPKHRIQNSTCTVFPSFSPYLPEAKGNCSDCCRNTQQRDLKEVFSCKIGFAIVKPLIFNKVSKCERLFRRCQLLCFLNNRLLLFRSRRLVSVLNQFRRLEENFVAKMPSISDYGEAFSFTCSKRANASFFYLYTVVIHVGLLLRTDCLRGLIITSHNSR